MEHFTKGVLQNIYECCCVPHILQSYCQLILFWWPETFNNGIKMKHRKYINNNIHKLFFYSIIFFHFCPLKQIQGR